MDFVYMVGQPMVEKKNIKLLFSLKLCRMSFRTKSEFDICARIE